MRHLIALIALGTGLLSPVSAQFFGSSTAKRTQVVAILPGTCSTGDLAYKIGASAGFYTCESNVWTLSGSGGTANDTCTITAAGTTCSKAHGYGSDPGSKLIGVCYQVTNNKPVDCTPTSDATSVTFTLDNAVAFDVRGTFNIMGGGAGGAGTPGGVNGQIQINNAGAFGGRTVGTGLVNDGVNIKVDPAALKTFLAPLSMPSWTFGTITAGACVTNTVAIAGSQLGDAPQIGPPADYINWNVQLQAAVTAAGTLSVKLCNNTAGNVATGGSYTWTTWVWVSF